MSRFVCSWCVASRYLNPEVCTTLSEERSERVSCPHPAVCSRLWRSWGTHTTSWAPSSARHAPLTWERPSVPPSLMSPPDRCCCTREGRIFSPTHLLSNYLCISEDGLDVTATQVLLYQGREGLLSNIPVVKLPMYQ